MFNGTCVTKNHIKAWTGANFHLLIWTVFLVKTVRRIYDKINYYFFGSNGGLVILDDSVRQYYGPPDPKVKILKRPTNSSEGNQVNGDSRPRQHKTLKQREQEYAEARLRILGEARSPDESPTSPSAVNANEGMNHLQTKLEVLTTSDQGKTAAQGVVGELRPAKVVIETDNILRTPRGPDGTKGFKRR
ncbi:hypothetical protein B566_EDAN001655 [Ephemera danica]|nr:hypothetical protein B566_EDAN001655 [Ephemera danica]